MKYIGILFLVLGTLLMSLSLLWVVSGCCHKPCHEPSNPGCDNYDPCLGKKPKTANFKMYQALSSTWVRELAFNDEFQDTALFGEIYFEAQDKNLEYTWIMGTDLFHTDSKYLDFDNPGTPQNVAITLRVAYPSDTVCFPNDDGKDEVTRNITFMHPEDAPYNGKFKGYFNNNPADTGSIEIDLAYYNPVTHNSSLFRLRRDGYINYDLSRSGSYKALAFTMDGSSEAPKGIARINPKNNNEITVTYKYHQHYYDDTDINLTFIGWRIP